MYHYNSQAYQDKFAEQILKQKYNGYFLEIGSARPIINNNTYLLENSYKWKGIMIEKDKRFLKEYKELRPLSHHVIQDAQQINYKSLLTECNAPNNIDFLQIDLDVEDGSTIEVLKKLDKEIFDHYKFATITFEHDIYRGDFFNTRYLSRYIFLSRGYKLVFPDVCHNTHAVVFEDWYVHPELVDMNYVEKVISLNEHNYAKNHLTQKSICGNHIIYK